MDLRSTIKCHFLPLAASSSEITAPLTGTDNDVAIQNSFQLLAARLGEDWKAAQVTDGHIAYRTTQFTLQDAYMHAAKNPDTMRPIKYDKIDLHNKKLLLTKTRLRDILSEGKGDCSICLEVVPRSGFVSQLKCCIHWFHDQCIQNWMEVDKTCPICRREIVVQ